MQCQLKALCMDFALISFTILLFHLSVAICLSISLSELITLNCKSDHLEIFCWPAGLKISDLSISAFLLKANLLSDVD